MARSIDDILEALAYSGADGYQAVVDLATEDPAQLTNLVLEGVSRLAKASTAIDASLALVPESRLAGVAHRSVELLCGGADRWHSQAASLIQGLSLQAPLTLQDHLGSLWDIFPNEGSYYSTWPWRAARSSEAIEQLTATLLDPDPEVVRRGWRCLTESRTPFGWAAALSAVGSRVADDQWSRGCFDLVGLEPTSNGYRKLFPERTTHVVFPEGFRVGGEPTWIQSPDYPPCPDCQRRMTFAMQFDSLDIDGGPCWLWGSGGILYVLWCANCSTSATFWQCT